MKESFIRLLPSSKIIKSDGISTLLVTLKKSGIQYPHMCGGKMQCVLCVCFVIDGYNNLTQITEQEYKAIVDMWGVEILPQLPRLACQTKTTGDIVICHHTHCNL